MRSRVYSIILGSLIAIIFLSGCGLIGGAFTLPEDEQTGSGGQNPGGRKGSNPGSGTSLVATPLPLETVSPYPTGIAQLPQECVDALSLTLDDNKKEMCVGGTVVLINQTHGTYYVYFSKERGTFFMEGPDWVDRIGLRVGECAYAYGRIGSDGVGPLMDITPYTLKRCPVSYSAQVAPRPKNLPESCAYAMDVTKDDIGKKMCVGGAVSFSEMLSKTYKIYFDADKSLGLHFVGENWTGRGVNSGDCIYVEGKFVKLESETSTPILSVIPSDIHFCPST
jgi:hypothetical protein